MGNRAPSEQAARGKEEGEEKDSRVKQLLTAGLKISQELNHKQCSQQYHPMVTGLALVNLEIRPLLAVLARPMKDEWNSSPYLGVLPRVFKALE
jgi:hypothetical protein